MAQSKKATNGKKQGTTILRLEVSNFQGLKAAAVEHVPERGLVKLTGPNGAGKSSVLKAIAGALGGKAQVHERAVNDASEDGTGTVSLELSNGFTIRRHHTEANPKGHLVVTGPDGGKHGQAKLQELVGPLSFDPLAFFGLAPARQREILLSLGSDPELAGKLDALKARYAKTYAERTPHISDQRRTRAVAKPQGERPEPVDTSAEMAKLGELQAQERERQDLAREAEDHERRARHCAAEVVATESKIEALRAQLAQAERELAMDHAGVAEAKAACAASTEALDAFPDPAEAIQATMARLSEADAVNAALQPWRTWDAAQEENAKAVDEVARLTDVLTAIEVEETALIAGAGIPVPGLSFDTDSSPLLNGRPLELASGGEKIDMAVNVAFAVNPDLKVCLIDEANDLDLERLDRLDKRGVEKGFQVWCCRIGLEGPGHVVVADGEAHSTAPEAAGQLAL